VKKAGDILSVLFDEGFVKKAQGYSKLFDSWTDITAKNRIAAAADHSRIKDLDRGILLIELDHPGWKQILQTKQAKLLNDFRMRFPELEISAISLMLGNNEPLPPIHDNAEENKTSCFVSSAEEPAAKGLDSIQDEEFKEMLKNLGQSVTRRSKI
jgi:hypothetical protein